MFNRLTDGLILSVIRSTDGPLMMLRGCSFTRETDGPLRVINGRLTDWTYCTLMFLYRYLILDTSLCNGWKSCEIIKIVKPL